MERKSGCATNEQNMRVRDLPWYRRERELEALEVRPFKESRQAHRLCAKPIAHGRRCLRCTPTASTTATSATATTNGGAQRLKAFGEMHAERADACAEALPVRSR